MSPSLNDLVEIYKLYIRSVVEQSVVLWHSSITCGEDLELEQVQKVALRIMLKDDYILYSHALEVAGLEPLRLRHQKLCLNFAKKCTKNELTQDMFPLNHRRINTRNPEKFHVPFARTEHFANSAIPYKSILLNKDYNKSLS